ncbi:MAG: FtsX-like permease family protein, partial [Vicinamibacterales bacterium]
FVIVFLGILPALRFRHADVIDDLRGGSTATPAPKTSRIHVWLAAGQMSLAMPLIAAAALLIASFARLHAIDPGFEPQRLLTMTLTLPAPPYGTPEAALAFHDRVIARVSAIPGVQAVAIGANPVEYLSNRPAGGVSITIEGGNRYLNGVPEQAGFTPGRRRVTPTYFRALGLPLVAGRGFTESDRRGAPLVAVVNESMARLHWPGQSALGKRVNFEAVRPGRPLAEPWTEIVGVVGDARQHRFDAPPRPEIYTPLTQTPYLLSTSTVLVRSNLSPLAIAAPVRQAIRDLDSAVPVFEVRTMTSIIDEATAAQRYAASLVALFAMLALALAAVGVYGLAALAAAQRVREIGIRMALGATRSDVRRFMLGQGLRPAAFGIGAGVLVAAFATRLLGALLYDIGPSDPLTFTLAVAVLLGAAVCASYLPARRASRLDPAVVLRAE